MARSPGLGEDRYLVGADLRLRNLPTVDIRFLRGLANAAFEVGNLEVGDDVARPRDHSPDLDKLVNVHWVEVTQPVLLGQVERAHLQPHGRLVGEEPLEELIQHDVADPDDLGWVVDHLVVQRLVHAQDVAAVEVDVGLELDKELLNI